QLMLDRTVPDEQKLPLALNLYYPDCPPDLSAAVKQMLWFYRCYIFAAFLADYGIDLEAIPYLHWWKYKALFDSLRVENKFCRILGYRAADTSAMKGEQRRAYERMKKLYALPRSADEQEKLDDIEEKLRHGGKL
ncbi:MAG: Gp15 family bacteriophage protein, partial [Oscillospiraceae bacterium]|nr:Gp15 family bacteriophage protein [Oscillospiraceae bacterium]